MGFGETIFLFLLALVIFGPKKLPEIARQAGRLLNEVKRASNEFKAQIEQEVNNLERQEAREEARKTLPPVAAPEGAVVNRRLNGAAAASDAVSSENILSDQSTSDSSAHPEPEAPINASAETPAASAQESHG